MIDYQRDQQQTIPHEEVKIIGIGGAGANILDRIALDGADAKSMMVLNSDTRTLQTAMAGEKIQMGKKLTMGLGAGGDPDIGLRSAQEVEMELRDALKNQKIVFICVGLGGGTGSGAAPLVTRIAREQGAFVVVFATMPFGFEGNRRLEQAETALNELSVLSNALVTFDNGKMGELVLPSQGIHEAFAAADLMVSQSVSAVIRLVVKPGIINVGLDDLMTALKATKSRCLFGSGLASGEDRSQKALKNALNSPLLDKGALLKSATTVLVHIGGGKTLSLYEVELLMRELSKHVPKDAHILFGAAVDDTMGEDLSVTVISALPESLLYAQKNESEDSDSAKLGALGTATAASSELKAEPTPEPEPEPTPEPEPEPTPEPEPEPTPEPEPEVIKEADPSAELPNAVISQEREASNGNIVADATTEDGTIVMEASNKGSLPINRLLDGEKSLSDIEDRPLDSQKVIVGESRDQLPKTELPPKRKTEPVTTIPASSSAIQKPQIELELDGKPKGKFSGESPNMVDGEDLDIPPYLRNR